MRPARPYGGYRYYGGAGAGAITMRETGFLQVDVEYDFLRARRYQVLAALVHRLRRWRGDGNRLVRLGGGADPAGAHHRPGRARSRLRPALPAPLKPGAVPVGAAGAGPAAR